MLSLCFSVFLLLFHSALVEPVQSGKCAEGEKLELPHGSIVNDNGSVLINEQVLHHETAMWNEGSKLFACGCDLKPCFKKCPEDVLSSNSLKQISNTTRVQIGEERNESHFSSAFTLLDDYIDCDLTPEVYFNTPGNDDYILTPKGEIIFLSDNETLNASEFCIADTGEDKNGVLLCETILSITHTISHDPFRTLIITLTVISAVMLFLNCIAISIAREIKNLQGKNIACQSFTLMIGLAGLAIISLTGHTLHEAYAWCKIIGYTTYCSLLSSFFWLSAMCFDIFYVSRNLRRPIGSHDRRFLIYSIFSTLCPLTLCAVVVICDNTLTSGVFYPGFGMESCWFRSSPGSYVQDLFFHGIILILMVVNILFTVFAMFKLNKLTQDTTEMNNGTSGTHHAENDYRQRATANFRLFFLMGATWVFEPISAWCDNEPHWFFYPIDVINASRGIFIFIICVPLNPRVRAAIIKLLPSRVPMERISSNNDTGVIMQNIN